jgi:hypothetical protein
MAATNVERGPHQTPLAVAVSIRPSSSSATADMDVAWMDDPSASPNTKPQTCAIKDYRASNVASASHRASSSTLRHPTASYKWFVSQARLGGGLIRRLQILAAGRSSFERHSSNLGCSTTNSPTTFIQATLLGERPSTNSAVEDTTTRNAASSRTISLWWRVASCIPSDRRSAQGGLRMVRHSSKPQVCRSVSLLKHSQSSLLDVSLARRSSMSSLSIGVIFCARPSALS